jgi:hypothetical protein
VDGVGQNTLVVSPERSCAPVSEEGQPSEAEKERIREAAVQLHDFKKPTTADQLARESGVSVDKVKAFVQKLRRDNERASQPTKREERSR